MVNSLACSISDKHLAILWGIMCLKAVEGKHSVLKKMEEIGLGDFMVPQASITLPQQCICH